VKLIEAIPDLANFVILLGNGKLGTYRDTGDFVVHQNFTEMFADHTAEFLKNYTANPEADGYRLGIVFPTQEERPWQSATLTLETWIVRTLYPSGGTRGEELTTFQKRNMDKSVYQGVELLMEHHDDALPGVQLLCPVLFFRQTTLDQYPHLLQRESTTADKRVPVMEVLNFLAPIPRGRRNTEGIGQLSKTIYNGVINKSVRKGSYGFFGEKGKSVPGGAASGAAITEQADQAFSSILGSRKTEGYSSWMQTNCSEETRRRVGRWLVEPYKYVKPERLRTFTRFRGLSMDGLTLLADQHPIFHAPAGSQLLARGTEDKWNMYLLDGAVELEAEDGEKIVVEANAPQAAAPIASLKPRMFTVTAKVPSKFLWIMDNLADTLINIDKENSEQELRIESLRNT